MRDGMQIRKAACFLCLLLALSILAPAGEKPRLGFHLSLSGDVAIGESKYALEPYPGWMFNFNLPRETSYGVANANPNAEVRQVRSCLMGDASVGVRPSLRIGRVEVGLPVKLYVSNFLPLPVTKVKADLSRFEENESLTVSKIGLVRRTPAAGVSLRFGRETGLEVEVLTYAYTLNESHYEETAYEAESRHRTGIGGMFYEVSYYTEYDSDVIETIKVSTGQAFHFSVGFWGDGLTVSGFADLASRYLRAGLSFGVEL